jgi:hypothetical protein
MQSLSQMVARKGRGAGCRVGMSRLLPRCVAQRGDFKRFSIGRQYGEEMGYSSNDIDSKNISSELAAVGGKRAFCNPSCALGPAVVAGFANVRAVDNVIAPDFT